MKDKKIVTRDEQVIDVTCDFVYEMYLLHSSFYRMFGVFGIDISAEWKEMTIQSSPPGHRNQIQI